MQNGHRNSSDAIPFVKKGEVLTTSNIIPFPNKEPVSEAKQKLGGLSGGENAKLIEKENIDETIPFPQKNDAKIDMVEAEDYGEKSDSNNQEILHDPRFSKVKSDDNGLSTAGVELMDKVMSNFGKTGDANEFFEATRLMIADNLVNSYENRKGGFADKFLSAKKDDENSGVISGVSHRFLRGKKSDTGKVA